MKPRVPDWETKLVRAVEAANNTPFKWGVHDCCTFTANCVEAMTGRNPMAQFIGKYHDKKSALRALRKFGKGSLYKTLESLFGAPISPEKAIRGDLAYGVFDDDPAVGICLGQYSVFTGYLEQQPALVTVPTKEISKIFCV